ncbi:sugar ABC transporter ATPase [Streptomyces gancidicus BKS 13-15]|uniref:Sugar ABC transporter ATPase n=1 Tax=Streptomyces gancidicus BKS 13-15 TaxID=1284664 RepID=M3CSW5_STREZ|nr:sugar ABC transporter ATPase [Streptomyces gancidicus BKS 13-15]
MPATAGSLIVGAWGESGSDSGLLGFGLLLVGESGEEALRVEGCRTAGTGRGDRLAVGVVHHVTGREDARDVGARRGCVDLQVALLVQLQLALEELGARVVTDRDEQAGHRQVGEFTRLDVAQLETRELLVTLDLGDLAVPDERDLRVGEGTLLHRLGGAQRVTAVDDRHGLGEARQEGRLLHSGVTAADDGDVLVLEEEAVTGGAPRDTAAGEGVLVRQPELPVLRTGRHDHGLRLVDRAGGVRDGLDLTGQVDGHDVVRDELGAEALRLGPHVVHELRAHDAVLETGEVLHLGGVHQRTAGGDSALEHEGLQRRTGGVERRRVAGGPRADDDHVTDVAHGWIPRLWSASFDRWELLSELSPHPTDPKGRAFPLCPGTRRPCPDGHAGATHRTGYRAEPRPRVGGQRA